MRRDTCWSSSRQETSISRYDQVWTTGMVSYAGAAIECPRPEVRRAPVRPTRPVGRSVVHRRRRIDAGPCQPFSRWPGYRPRPLRRGRHLLRSSRRVQQQSGAKFFAARTDLMWGRMLAERQAPGDTENARKLLNKAHSAAKAHGYGNVERRAAAALELLDALTG